MDTGVFHYRRDLLEAAGEDYLDCDSAAEAASDVSLAHGAEFCFF